MLTNEQYRRVRILQDRREARELEPDFQTAIDRLHVLHYDLPDTQFHAWEQHLVDRDQLALGAVLAMMTVRESRLEMFEANSVA